MKKILAVVFTIVGIIFSAALCQADTLVPPANGASDPAFLSPDNQANEEAWLEILLNQDVDFVGYKEPSYTGHNTLTNYDPGFDWDYAVVKIGGSANNGNNQTGDHFAFLDDPNDNKLSFDIFATYGVQQGISHINFFKGSSPVPEPATMLLFGTGLAGLAAVGRRKRS